MQILQKKSVQNKKFNVYVSLIRFHKKHLKEFSPKKFPCSKNVDLFQHLKPKAQIIRIIWYSIRASSLMKTGSIISQKEPDMLQDF